MQPGGDALRFQMGRESVSAPVSNDIQMIDSPAALRLKWHGHARHRRTVARYIAAAAARRCAFQLSRWRNFTRRNAACMASRRPL